MTRHTVRDRDGYRQVNEGDGWKFIVTGFDGTSSGEAGYCTVLKADGSKDCRVPIDARDRILIAGRRYSRRSWVH